MKVSVTAICLLLLAVMAPEAKANSSSQGPYHPAECCFIYVTRPVQRHRIAHYYETSSECSKPGIVFITKKGYSICANPKDDWVQDYIKDLEEN